LLDTNPRSLEILLLIAVATETLIAMNRHKGQLLLRQGQTEAAEELYRRARSIAEEQEAKLWELRAAASLARLRRDQGRHTEARDLLAPVYGWFTEGFDTADLKEAKAPGPLVRLTTGSRQVPRFSKPRRGLPLDERLRIRINSAPPK
jgi:hypothetical protein